MADIYHIMGQDISFGATGDLAMATGSDETTQRILRSLLTNPLAYCWFPNYGAGLPAMIGNVADADRIRALALDAMAADDAVAASPAPLADVQVNPDGSVYLNLQYADRLGAQQSLSFTVVN